MKRNLFPLFFPILFLFFQLTLTKDGCGSKSNVQESIDDSVLLQKLKLVDKKKYIGLTVDSFMKEETISKFKDYNFIDEPVGELSFLFLQYSKKIHIRIFVDEYKYINPRNPNYSKKRWELSEFKKETISAISFINDRTYVERIK